MKTVGEKIKELRTESNMTQKELADLVGCCREQICNIEKNKAAVTSDVSYALCDVFNCDMNTLYDYKSG